MTGVQTCALPISIKLEMDGKDYYLEKAEIVTSSLTKRVFQSLADDEERHLQKVKAIYHAVKTVGGWPQHETLVPSANDLNQIFSDAKDEASPINEKTTDYDALKLAVEMEKKSITFYADLQSKAEVEDEKQFLDMIIAEEEEHLRILTDTMYYLFNTADFFSEEEKSMYE